MGERQEALFYEFSLERHAPATHLLRAVDRLVDLSVIRAHLRPFYSDTGRPLIDPELMSLARQPSLRRLLQHNRPGADIAIVAKRPIRWRRRS